MKIKLLLSAVFLIIIFVFAHRLSQKPQAVQEQPKAKAPQAVTVQEVLDSQQLTQTLTFPANVVGDQQITVTAKSQGNALEIPVNLGDRVSVGSLLARIDDTGNVLSPDKTGFQSVQVQQSRLTKKQAQEQLEIAQKNYADLKDAYQKQQQNPTANQNITQAQIDAAKEQIEIAEYQLKSTKVGFKGTLDNHLITSPIAGYVVEKDVSVGDAVNVGQKLFSVSQTKNIKFQFYVDQTQLGYFSKGIQVTVEDITGRKAQAYIKNISPIADPVTKRFLIEAYPQKQDLMFASGTIANVSFDINQKVSVGGNLLLPLSVITVGQNESYIFVEENGTAKKVNVQISAVKGDYAEIVANLNSDQKIIMSGSKLVQDGDAVSVQN